MNGKKFTISITTKNNPKNVEFEFGDGITLISGKPGSGKSTIIRQLLTHMANDNNHTFDVRLADTSGYEFNKEDDLPANIIKDYMQGKDSKDMERFVDSVYEEFLRRRDFIVNNCFGSKEKLAKSVVIIDDIYILVSTLTYEYIQKLSMVMELSKKSGMQFILACQNENILNERSPLSVGTMIDQRICLS